MANKKISALTSLGGTPADGDIIPITDISDTTGSPQGTTKKVTVANLVSAVGISSGTAVNLPASPSVSDIYLETDTGILRWWDGTYWNTFVEDSQYDPAFAANQLSYSGGLYTSSNYNISTQPIMHFDANFLDGADNDNNPSHGTAVSTWGDRSGQATNYDATQATGSSQPTYGVSGSDRYVSFDGGDILDIANTYTRTSTSPFTLVQVGNATSSGSIYYMAPNVGSSYGSVQMGKYSDGNFYVTALTLATGKDYSTFNLLTVTRNGSNTVEAFRDGDSSEGSVTATSTFNFDSVGSSGGTKTNGRIYECMLFDSVLSNTDLNTINSYLANKYSGLPTLTTWT